MKNVIFTYDTIQNGERGEACAMILVEDAQAWAGEVANYATTLNQLAEVLTALRKVARDSEILMEREEKV